MTTMADIVKNHVPVRKCKSVSKGGCGNYKPESEFMNGTRIDEMGAKQNKWTGWCKPCQRRRSSAYEEGMREKARQKAANEGMELIRLHTVFFMIPPTECQRVNRYVISDLG